MDLLKTPHQMLLEEAGAKVPTVNGMLKTPQQLLMEETGLPQKFAGGGKILSQLEKFLEGSKIPQRLFHGTTASEEKGAKALSQLKQSKEGALGAGVYMTPNPEFAGQYANQTGGYIMPVHANLKNPLEIYTKSGVEGNGDPMKLALMQLGVPESKADQILEKAYDTRGYVGKEVMSRAQKQGYDGIAQYRDGDLSEVVSYNPMGVKSSTGNSGEFDPYDPRLSKAEGGSIQSRMSPQDMIAEIMAQGQTPQKFAVGGQPEQTSPELAKLLDRLYNQQIYSGELPPEPTFQAQPATVTSKVRDKFASVIGNKPADRLFGTGSEGRNLEYLPLQFLNPVSAITETIDAAPEAVRQLRQGEMLGAGLTAGAVGLNALPFAKPIKNIIKKIKNK